AHVDRVELAEVHGPGLDQVGDLEEDLGPLARGDARPGPFVGGPRGRDRRVDVRLVALGDDGDDRAVVGADALEGPAGLALDELAVDEELVATGAVRGAEGQCACHEGASFFRIPLLGKARGGGQPAAAAARQAIRMRAYGGVRYRGRRGEA